MMLRKAWNIAKIIRTYLKHELDKGRTVISTQEQWFHWDRMVKKLEQPAILERLRAEKHQKHSGNQLDRGCNVCVSRAMQRICNWYFTTKESYRSRGKKK